MGKAIVFCADGTWNGPGDTDPTRDGGDPKLTNVCKLFGWLQGTINGAWGTKEMELALGPAAAPIQVAKYIHGVGDSPDLIAKVAGGAFGVGVTARIARGYTYLSRNYVPGDRIVIVGFSRGAYTARALAGMVAAQGLLKPDLASDPATKYDNAVRAWFRYRHGSDSPLICRMLDSLDEFVNIRSVFGSDELPDNPFVPVDDITAVAVWDTVGALGIPLYDIAGHTLDLFGFADTRLSPKVTLGLHAVSIDEQRKSFQPTLWDDAANVTQALFAGGHSDVGGGYKEHGLSDVPLAWFVDRLQHPDVGLAFQRAPPTPVAPDACGCAHREWLKPPWDALGTEPRSFRAGMLVNDAVRQRMEAITVPPDPPPAAAEKYAPTNLPG
ncbi:MAG: hypothetical protein OJF60_000428 [Burkholderiaceae bacterium]|jgi:hypothetical protein|nr:MAG: hypothetical protein OJF60_000428 [Burkholderiaceae bacterium]